MRDSLYELDLFRRIQDAVVDGVPLTEETIAGDAVIWQRFHAAVFETDIRSFVRARSFSDYRSNEQLFKRSTLQAIGIALVLLIISIGAALSLVCSRKRVVLFAIDMTSDPTTGGDFRMRPLYHALGQRRYTEIFHTNVAVSAVTRFFSRRRLALYLEAIDWVWYVSPFTRKKQSFVITGLSGTDDEIQFMKSTVRKYMALRGLLVFRTAVLKQLLRMSGVRLIVGIDDTRHYHELLEAARQLDIKTVVAQHGHFTKYHVGWLGGPYKGRYQKADQILVWSEYWKQELLRLGSVYREDEIVVAGYPRTQTPPVFQKKDDSDFIVLIPYERDAPLQEVSEYIVAAAQCEGVRVFLKLRPDLAMDEQLAAYPKAVRPRVTPVTDLTAMPRPDVVMGVYSTFLYDMALLGIPIIRMKTSSDYGEEMVTGGIADEVALEEVENILQKSALPSASVIAERVARLGSTRDFSETLLGIMRMRGVV